MRLDGQSAAPVRSNPAPLPGSTHVRALAAPRYSPKHAACILDFSPIWEGREVACRGENPSSLDTLYYFGGSCVPTMSVRTVVPSGFSLYLTKSSRLPFV